MAITDQFQDKNNFYQILDVNKKSSLADIKKAYHVLAKKYHPDKNPNNKAQAEILFKKIQAAYETLSDLSKRTAYDMTLEPSFFWNENNFASQNNFSHYPQGFWQHDSHTKRDTKESKAEQRTDADKLKMLQTLANSLYRRSLQSFMLKNPASMFANLFYEIAYNPGNHSSGEHLNVLMGVLIFGQKYFESLYTMRTPNNSFTYVEIKTLLEDLLPEENDATTQIQYLTALKQFAISMSDEALDKIWHGKASLLNHLDKVIMNMTHKTQSMNQTQPRWQ